MNLLKAPIAKAGGLITRAAGQGKLILIKNGPHLMVYGGLIGVGVAIYEYCKATIQLEEARKQHRQTLEAIRTSIEDNKERADFDQKHYSKLIFEEKRDYGLVLVKRYWAPTTLTLASFGLILTGFHKINARLGVMTVAYKALEDSYARYRQNVLEDAGEEKDREYLYGLKREKVEGVIVDEDGNKKKVDAEVLKPKNNQEWSVYSRFFDEYSSKWTSNASYNMMFLNAMESTADDKLYAQRYLFLSDVFEALGLPDCEMAHVVGWYLTPKEWREHKKHVDFRIMDLAQLSESKRLFVNGYEPSILLDFNVDGVIWDKVFPKKKR